MTAQATRKRRPAPGIRTGAITFAVLLLPACADAQTASPAATASTPLVCTAADVGRQLPEAVRETSGLAMGRSDTTVFWTHNDSGSRVEIYGLHAGGDLARTVKIAGASVADWEDIEAGPCDEGNCLYIADTGDNGGSRKSIAIYRIAEPAAGANNTTANATKISLEYPEGPEDAEAIFVLPSRDIYVVTKGRHKTISLYAAKAPKATGTNVLVKVREIFPKPTNERDRVTAATASPDGKWVAIRTYRTLYVYRADALTSGAATEPLVFDLTPLSEVQGESVALADDGRVWLTSEAEDKKNMPTSARLTCALPN